MADVEQTWRRVADEFAEASHSDKAASFEVNEQGFEYGGIWLDQMQEQVREAAMSGVPFEVAESIKVCMQWSDESLAAFIRLSVKTLQRNRAKGKRLGVDAAEKIMELAELFAMGKDTFGDAARFLSWLKSPNLALGGVAPETFLFDAMGRRLIKEQILRIEFGVWV
jgi:putative toxin-antitoxin system antitoxin component (TIGR02293 family)